MCTFIDYKQLHPLKSFKHQYWMIGVIFVFFVTACNTVRPQRPPVEELINITAESSADNKALTFKWSVSAIANKGEIIEIETVKVGVYKDTRLLRKANNWRRKGAFSITPYRAGDYSIDITAVASRELNGHDDRFSVNKTITINTVGNLPKPCPSHAVWKPTDTANNLKPKPLYSPVDLLQEAQLVFAGNVAAVEFCAAAEDKVPYTYVTFNKLKNIHGTLSTSELTIAIPGGVMDGEVTSFVQMPTFKREERVVLFLTGRKKHLNPIVGWKQGGLLSQKDGIKTYYGQPIIAISENTFSINSSIATQPKSHDLIYGLHKSLMSQIGTGRTGPKGRVIQNAPSPKMPLTEIVLIRQLKELIKRHNIPTPTEGIYLPPGKMSKFPRILAAPAPKGSWLEKGGKQ